MKQIEMSQRRLKEPVYALVDDDDYEKLLMYNWSLHSGGRYPATFLNGKFIYMHHMIMPIRKGMYTDHKDRNVLNNQKSNLRQCERGENNMNREISLNNTSGYRGVVFDKQKWKWKAQIKVDYSCIFLGRFYSKEEAALAYNKAALKYFGEFAVLNKIPDSN